MTSYDEMSDVEVLTRAANDLQFRAMSCGAGPWELNQREEDSEVLASDRRVILTGTQEDASYVTMMQPAVAMQIAESWATVARLASASHGPVDAFAAAIPRPRRGEGMPDSVVAVFARTARVYLENLKDE